MAEPRWLDDDEQRAWRGFIRMYAEVSSRLRRQLQRDAGLSDAEYSVLVELSESPDGRLRAFRLGETLQWEKSRLSHQLSRMQLRGLVEREECETDRRGAWIVVTPDGRDAIERAAPLHVAEVRRAFFDALSARQVQSLIEVTDAVLDHVADVVPAGLGDDAEPGPTG